jgi:hypothetical protein
MTVEAAMREPGPFLAYTHGDACPDNFLLTDRSPRFIDFEGGLYGHALRDGAYARLHFATCWCVYRLPERIWRGMEDIYRAELARGCPEASEYALFGRGLVEACAYRTLEFFQSFHLSELLERDREIATSTARQRVLLRFETVAQASEEFGHLEALGAMLRDAAERLRALWRPAAMPYYPAFHREPMELNAPHRYRTRPLRETLAIEGPASGFFRKGRLSAMPAKRKNRLSVLSALADCFEPHRTYTENEVNEVLLHVHDDYCSLRRALVDEGFLSRVPSGAKYWRMGPAQ